jgi:uncharacterized protein YjiS (DUF1127 family)
MTGGNFSLKSIAQFFVNLNEKRIQRKEIKRTIKELSALSDRELNDMGLTRGDIYSVAHGTADLKAVRENANLRGWV